jgi:hypothetical protein
MDLLNHQDKTLPRVHCYIDDASSIRAAGDSERKPPHRAFAVTAHLSTAARQNDRLVQP